MSKAEEEEVVGEGGDRGTGGVRGDGLECTRRKGQMQGGITGSRDESGSYL